MISHDIVEKMREMRKQGHPNIEIDNMLGLYEGATRVHIGKQPRGVRKPRKDISVDEVLRMKRSGMLNREIADKLHVHINTIQKLTVGLDSPARIPDDLAHLWHRQYMEGMNYKDIANESGRTYTSVYNAIGKIRSRLEIRRRILLEGTDDIMNDESMTEAEKVIAIRQMTEKEIRDLYEKGYSASKISDLLGIRETVVRGHIERIKEDKYNG